MGEKNKIKVVVFTGKSPVIAEKDYSDQLQITVGRYDAAKTVQPDIMLDDPRVSRRHSKILHKGDRWFIEDLNSKHNTFVDGADINGKGAVEFTPGTFIKTGDTIWTLIPGKWLFVYRGDVIIYGPCASAINYALYHCGVPLIGPIEAANSGSTFSPAFELTLQINDYSDTRRIQIPSIQPFDKISIGYPAIPLKVEMLKMQMEPAKTSLRVEIDGKAVSSFKKRLTVLGLWDWSLDLSARRTIAVFVSPRHNIVEQIVLESQAYLKNETGRQTFYELLKSGNDTAELIIIEAIYNYLERQRNIIYGVPYIDGDYQVIRPAHHVFSDKNSLDGQGTCLDLVLLMAGCLENVGLSPLVILTGAEDGTPRHALAGCWIGLSPCSQSVFSETDYLRNQIASGSILPVECLGFAAGTGKKSAKLDFDEARKNASEQIMEAKWICAVDIRCLRPPYGSITPIDCPFEPVVSRAYNEAIKLAKSKQRECVEMAHLFYGLLAVQGEVIKWLSCEAGFNPKEFCGKFSDIIVSGNYRGQPNPTRNFNDCQRLAEDLAWRCGATTVREQDLLWAVLMQSSHSSVFSGICRQAGIDLEQFANIFQKKYPCSKLFSSVSSFAAGAGE